MFWRDNIIIIIIIMMMMMMMKFDVIILPYLVPLFVLQIRYTSLYLLRMIIQEEKKTSKNNTVHLVGFEPATFISSA